MSLAEETNIRLEQSKPEVIVEQRTPGGWVVRTYSGLGMVAEIGFGGLVLALADLYEDVTFPA